MVTLLLLRQLPYEEKNVSFQKVLPPNLEMNRCFHGVFFFAIQKKVPKETAVFLVMDFRYYTDATIFLVSTTNQHLPRAMSSNLSIPYLPQIVAMQNLILRPVAMKQTLLAKNNCE